MKIVARDIPPRAAWALENGMSVEFVKYTTGMRDREGIELRPGDKNTSRYFLVNARGKRMREITGPQVRRLRNAAGDDQRSYADALLGR